MQLNIGWIFNTLELDFDVTTVPEKINPKKANRLEQKLIKNARKNFRRLSKKHHPDHGGDPIEFMHLKDAYNHIQRIKLKPPKFSGNYIGIEVGIFGSGLIRGSDSRWHWEIDRLG